MWESQKHYYTTQKTVRLKLFQGPLPFLPSLVHMCYSLRTAGHTRESTAMYPDKERILWHGFSSAMPARIKPRSVRSISACGPSTGSSHGWMKKTCCRGRNGRGKSHEPCRSPTL